MGFRWELWDLDGFYMRYTSHKFYKSVKCTTYIFLVIVFLLVFCMSHLTPITPTIAPTQVWHKFHTIYMYMSSIAITTHFLELWDLDINI